MVEDISSHVMKFCRRTFDHNNAIVFELKYEKNHDDDDDVVVNEKQSNADVRDAAQLIYNRQKKIKEKHHKKNRILMSPCITVTIDSSTIIIALILSS